MMFIDVDENILLFNVKYLKQKEFWLNKLGGHLEKTDIVPHQKKINSPQPEKVKISIPFTSALCPVLLRLSKGVDILLFTILLAGVKLLIQRYAGNSDCVLTPVHKQKISEDTLNDYVVVRDKIEPHLTFKQFLKNVRESLIEAYANQDYPLERILTQLYEDRRYRSSGSVSTVACCLNSLHHQTQWEGTPVKLSFSFHRQDHDIDGEISYSSNHYPNRYIKQMARQWGQLLTNLLENMDAKVSEVSLLSREDYNQLVYQFNRNHSDLPGVNVCQLFENLVEQAPDRIAVSFDTLQLSYKELGNRGDRLSEILLARGLGQDRAAVVLLERSPGMVISILALWKINACYIPVDIEDPFSRITSIIKDSNTRVVLTDERLRQKYSFISLKEAGWEILTVDRQKGTSLVPPYRRFRPGNQLRDIAYIIYTSGSTGKPKGVVVEHQGMLNHIQAKINDLDITAQSIVAQNSSHTFDISIWQFFAALTRGGKTIIFRDELILRPDRFIRRVIEAQVSILEVVPSYLMIMLDFLDSTGERLDTLNYLMVTGETIQSILVKKWFQRYPGIRMVNAYGPTEASDDITHHFMVKDTDGNQVPIGKPLQNLNIYIMDENRMLCPIGVKGQICVSGIGVGRGYLNNPELTSKRFINYKQFSNHKIQNPYPVKQISIVNKCNNKKFLQGSRGQFFQKAPPGRRRQKTYLTGDLGAWSPDGSIDFFGRIDYQVKIRGYRIELEEIESVLFRHPGVKEVVVDQLVENENIGLCAYWVARNADTAPDSRELKTFLFRHLPDYMVPAYFVIVDRIPLTANGKVDRKVLAAYSPQLDAGVRYESPKNATEKIIAQTWKEVLKADKIGIHDNFFDVGGNSIHMIRVNAKLRSELKQNIDIMAMFEYPTISAYARYLDGEAEVNPFSPEEEIEANSTEKLNKTKNRVKKIIKKKKGSN